MGRLTREDFTWIFRDPEWKEKFLVGSLVAFAGMVPLVGLVAAAALYGYALILMRREISGQSPVLPRWNDIGSCLVDGARAWIASLGYVLPGTIVLLVSFSAWFLGYAAAVAGAAVESKSGAAPTFVPIFFITWLVGFLALGVGMVLYYAGMILLPAAVGQYLRTGQMGAGYRFREIWNILRGNPGGWALAWLVYLGVGAVLGFAVSMLFYTIILCLFVPLLLAPVHFYIMLLYARLFGAAYRDGAQRAGYLDTNLMPSPGGDLVEAA